ncbi:uncharacterized protein LOC144506076 [Mustelus asterias]
MSVKFLFVIFGGIALTLVDNARIFSRVKRQSLKVRITAKDDSIVLQYLSPGPAIKLQGHILGYGGRFSKQNITLPDNGDPLEVDVEFNPKYLIAVHPVAEQSKAALKKKCKGNLDLQKPPQIMIATRTPTSVFLTWTNSFKGKVYKHVGNECADESHFTVRYREKERNKNWLYQCCPTSETTIDDLKPNTVYEFGVRVTKAKEEGVWSEPTNYITTVTSSPTSTENDQRQKISKKISVNTNSENPKYSRKSEPSGKANIIGIKDKKDLAAPNPGRNGTNRIQFFPKKPHVNTGVVLGGQSASDSANLHSGTSSSPKPIIPERTPDQFHGKEDINKFKDKEYGALPSIISNIITLHTTSEPRATEKQESTEPVVQPTVDTFLTTSNKIDEFDSTQRKQISEFEIPSSKSSFIFTSEFNAVDKQKFTDYELPISDILLVLSPIPMSETPKIGIKEFTGLPRILVLDHELPASDSPYEFSLIPESERSIIEKNNVKGTSNNIDVLGVDSDME